MPNNSSYHSVYSLLLQLNNGGLEGKILISSYENKVKKVIVSEYKVISTVHKISNNLV